MPQAPIDTKTLTGIINQCFANATDNRFSLGDQRKFLIEGKRLRGQLLTMLGTMFDDSSEKFAEVSEQIAKVNEAVANDAEVLANTAAVLNDIATLAGNLDALLNTATSLIL